MFERVQNHCSRARPLADCRAMMLARVLSKVVIVGMAAGMLSISCGGDSSSKNPPTTTSSSSSAASKIAAAVCGSASACCKAVSKSFTQSKCESGVESAVSAVIGADAGPTTSADACVKAITAAVKKCDFTDWSFGSDACTAFFGAHLSAHAAEGDDCDRACTLIPTASGISLGGSIVAPECVPIDPTAVPPKTPVGSCFTNDGLFCDPDTKKCAAQVQIGATCAVDAACAGSYCKHGTCTDLVTPVPDASSCAASPASCCSASKRACQLGAFCDADVSLCKTNHPDNVTCNFDAECLSGHCGGNVCAASQPLLDAACGG